MPASLSNAVTVFSLGAATFGSSNAMISIAVAGGLYWNRDEASGFPLLDSDVRGQRIAVIVEAVDADTMNIYVNDGVTPVATFNPFDAVGAQFRPYIFGRGSAGQSHAGTKIGSFFLKESAHNPSNDPSIEDIMDHMMNEYGVA